MITKQFSICVTFQKYQFLSVFKFLWVEEMLQTCPFSSWIFFGLLCFALLWFALVWFGSVWFGLVFLWFTLSSYSSRSSSLPSHSWNSFWSLHLWEREIKGQPKCLSVSSHMCAAKGFLMRVCILGTVYFFWPGLMSYSWPRTPHSPCLYLPRAGM